MLQKHADRLAIPNALAVWVGNLNNTSQPHNWFYRTLCRTRTFLVIYHQECSGSAKLCVGGFFSANPWECRMGMKHGGVIIW